ncbi:MAG: DUF86 domain-containing protein [Methanospirillum sp.]|uniref:HepT-like ribonuclease domain-containing protein n=1 Tax=Methanospirillum sp. TaxID=45200 RepID=UPI002375E3EC|nr:HepT-like ribonuclease domain-containing protein [Methanospirillum sp.]MDD1729415.1 DUF86 domain-containing protein [Methanospirillum sp.]
MCEAIDRIDEFTKDYSYEEFCQDPKTVSAIRDQLMIIGEAARNIPEDIRSCYPDIPWEGMVGSRNILIHQYFRSDPELLFSNIKRAKRDIRERLLEIISALQ